MSDLKFSIIVPVFNRPEEIKELLESLSRQNYQNIEVIVVEDGSTIKCESVTRDYATRLNLQYYYKPNTGPGHSRNFGADKATGDYLVFFDSDCVIPTGYLDLVSSYLSINNIHIYGGPDRTPVELSNTQKAINYSMTSFLTTGGIRGHRRASKSFQPRSFNMGVEKKAFIKVGGFSDIHPGEDPDLVYRMVKLGFSKGFIEEAFVYHKRRVNFAGFARQVYKFGLARTILMKWHAASRKWIFSMPTLATLLALCFVVLGLIHPIFWYLLLSGLLIVFVDAFVKTKSPITSFLAVIATIIQVSGYGWGFVKGCWYLFIMKHREQDRFRGMFMRPEKESA